MLFSTVALPFYIPTNTWSHSNEWVGNALCFWFAFPSMISDVEHLFLCLLSICTSSLENNLFKSFAHFWIKLFVFLLLSCRSSLYILDTNPLSDIWFAIFPPILWVAFLLWILSFDILFFLNSSWSPSCLFFSFHTFASYIIAKKLFQVQSHDLHFPQWLVIKHLSCFILRVLSFQVYI